MPKLFTRRRLFAGFATFGAVAGLLGLRSAAARYYDGPVSDHFDGTRFFDPHGSPPKSLAMLLRWYSGRDKAEWPGWAPSAYSDRPPPRLERVDLHVVLLCEHPLGVLSTGSQA